MFRYPTILFKGWFCTPSKQLVATANPTSISVESSGRWSTSNKRRACAASALEGCREPYNLVFLHKKLGWFHVFTFLETYFPLAVLEGEDVVIRLGLCYWSLSIQLEGSGVWRAQTLTSKSPSIEVGVLSRLWFPEVFAGEILLCQYLNFYLRVAGFPRISSCCGCCYDQRPFKSASEYKLVM